MCTGSKGPRFPVEGKALNLLFGHTEERSHPIVKKEESSHPPMKVEISYGIRRMY